MFKIRWNKRNGLLQYLIPSLIYSVVSVSFASDIFAEVQLPGKVDTIVSYATAEAPIDLCYNQYSDCIESGEHQDGIYITSFEYSAGKQKVCYDRYLSCLEPLDSYIRENISIKSFRMRYILEPKTGAVFLENFSNYFHKKQRSNEKVLDKCRRSFNESFEELRQLRYRKQAITFLQAKEDSEVYEKLGVAREHYSCFQRSHVLARNLQTIQTELTSMMEKVNHDLSFLQITDSEKVEKLSHYISAFLQKYSNDKMFAPMAIYGDSSIEYIWKKVSITETRVGPVDMIPEVELQQNFKYDRALAGWELIRNTGIKPESDNVFRGFRLIPIPSINISDCKKSSSCMEMSRIDYVKRIVNIAQRENADFNQLYAEWFAEHQDMIPEEFRKYTIVFPGTIWIDTRGSYYIMYLQWDRSRWILGFDYITTAFMNFSSRRLLSFSL